MAKTNPIRLTILLTLLAGAAGGAWYLRGRVAEEESALPPTAFEPIAFGPEGVATLVPIARHDGMLTSVAPLGTTLGQVLATDKCGRVLALDGDRFREKDVVDLRDRVNCRSSEQGLLSAVLDPARQRLYVNYTAADGATVVSRLPFDAQSLTATAAAEEVLLRIEQPWANHNGGQLQFGPDGLLYIGMGDGGAAGDPGDRAENPAELLGKMLRLEVKGPTGYTVPPTNPFVGLSTHRPEIWALGLRNPWRFSFDRLTGDLYIADVGQGRWEEINRVAPGSPGGMSFGWNTMEAHECFATGQPCATDTTLPVWSYDHSHGCSITGGYVVRDPELPELAGWYLFADFCSGRIEGLQQDGAGDWGARTMAVTELKVASFGEGPGGELYVVSLDGVLFALRRT